MKNGAKMTKLPRKLSKSQIPLSYKFILKWLEIRMKFIFKLKN